VTLDSLLATYHNGSTPEEIAIQFSVLSLEDIYSAIADLVGWVNERKPNTLGTKIKSGRIGIGEIF
jgi:hypothetical protein